MTTVLILCLHLTHDTSLLARPWYFPILDYPLASCCHKASAFEEHTFLTISLKNFALTKMWSIRTRTPSRNDLFFLKLLSGQYDSLLCNPGSSRCLCELFCRGVVAGVTQGFRARLINEHTWGSRIKSWQGHICHAQPSILEQGDIDGYCSRWPSGNWEPSDLLGMMGQMKG